MERRNFLGILGGLIVVPKFGRWFRPNRSSIPLYPGKIFLAYGTYGLGFKITRQMIESSATNPEALLQKMRRNLELAHRNLIAQQLKGVEHLYESTTYEEWNYAEDCYVEKIIIKPKRLGSSASNSIGTSEREDSNSRRSAWERRGPFRKAIYRGFGSSS